MSLSLDRELLANCYDPLNGDPIRLPDGPGIYLVCGKSVISLPPGMNGIQYKMVNNKPLIYIGTSAQSIRRRIYRDHIDRTACGSTLRKSMGCLLGFERQYLDNHRYRFMPACEIELSKFLRETVVFFFHECTDYDLFEELLINKYCPPLNLTGNNGLVNQEFRIMLSILRQDDRI